jgi:predicted SPOUT superfamily RNA methylase MTH1
MTPPTTPALPPLPEPSLWIEQDGRKHGLRAGWCNLQHAAQHGSGSELYGVFTADQMQAYAIAALSAARLKVEVRMLTEEERRAAIDEWQVEDYGFSVAIQRKFAEVNNLKVKEQGNGN